MKESMELFEKDTGTFNQDVSKFNYKTKDFINYVSYAKKNTLLTSSEEKRLFSLYKNGDTSAKTKIIECNLGLVISIALNYYIKNYGKVDILDLIQSGSVGLINAIDTFDLKKGFKFSTYAYVYILSEICKEISRSNVFSISSNTLIRKNELNRFREKFAKTYGKDPDVDDYMKGLGYSKQTVIEILNLLNGVQSLEEAVSSQNGRGILELEDKNTNDEFEVVVSDMMAIYLIRMAKKLLSTRDFHILLARTGLNEEGQIIGDELSQEQVAKMFRLTRQRIDQIEEATQKKLSKYVTR